MEGLSASAMFLLLLGFMSMARAGEEPKALMCSPLAPWLLANSGTTSNLHDVFFANGVFVAVGTSQNVTCSPADLLWTNAPVYGLGGPYSGAWNGVAYGHGLFLGVGFRPVGVLRRYEGDLDGSWHDGLLMDLLADELT